MGWLEAAFGVALTIALSIGFYWFTSRLATVKERGEGTKISNKTAVLIILGAVLVFVGVGVMAALR